MTEEVILQGDFPWQAAECYQVIIYVYIYIYMKEINMVSGDIIQLLVPRKIKKALTFQDGRKSTAEGLSCISLTHVRCRSGNDSHPKITDPGAR